MRERGREILHAAVAYGLADTMTNFEQQRTAHTGVLYWTAVCGPIKPLADGDVSANPIDDYMELVDCGLDGMAGRKW